MANYMQQLPDQCTDVPKSGVKAFLRNPAANDKGKTIVLGMSGWFDDAQLRRESKSANQYAKEVKDLIAMGCTTNKVINAHWVGFLGLAQKYSYEELVNKIRKESPKGAFGEIVGGLSSGAMNLLGLGGGGGETQPKPQPQPQPEPEPQPEQPVGEPVIPEGPGYSGGPLDTPQPDQPETGEPVQPIVQPQPQPQPGGGSGGFDWIQLYEQFESWQSQDQNQTPNNQQGKETTPPVNQASTTYQASGSPIAWLESHPMISVGAILAITLLIKN